jgi:predicted dehydrogenase
MLNDQKTDRRSFLKTFSLLYGSTLLMSQMPWLKELYAQESARTVKLGIIGSGSRGTLLQLVLKEIPGCDMTCVCDNYPPNLAEGLKIAGPGAKAYSDYKEMLSKEKLDGVIIATPLFEHARMTIDALNSGIHVFCEKSMAKTIEDAKMMVEAQQKTGKILLIGHQRLFNVKYQRAIQLIRDGKLGKITHIRAYWHRNNDWRRLVPSPEFEKHINWRLYKEFSCGLMTELGSHQIQVANQILNQPPEYVWGSGTINYWNEGSREVEDNVSLVYKYPCGTHLIYDSINSNKHYGLEEQIMGPKGTMELEGGKMWDENPPPAPGILQLLNQLEHKLFDSVPIGGPSWVPDEAVTDHGEYIWDEVLKSDGTEMEMEAFVSMVRENKFVPELLKQGFHATVSALMGYQAMQENKIIYWPTNLPV